MADPNRKSWTQTHMRWLALSRWDDEGGCQLHGARAGLSDERVDADKEAATTTNSAAWQVGLEELSHNGDDD